jgi:hypothetical protein
VQYTITSRGRPIGVTDLGFRCRGGAGRMGWFHPNADGERLMPIVAAVTAATREYAQRFRAGEPDCSSIEDRQQEARLLADIAEAYQHADALELELHAEDGPVIPTDSVSILDTEELLAWPDAADATDDAEFWKLGGRATDPLYDPLEDLFDEELDALEHDEPCFDPDADDEIVFGDGFANEFAPWTPDEYEPDPSMRYQIFVSLLDPKAIP